MVVFIGCYTAGGTGSAEPVAAERLYTNFPAAYTAPAGPRGRGPDRTPVWSGQDTPWICCLLRYNVGAAFKMSKRVVLNV